MSSTWDQLTVEVTCQREGMQPKSEKAIFGNYTSPGLFTIP